ncbi:MAG: DUF368 domain-containing protein [Calditrichia bacterium]
MSSVMVMVKEQLFALLAKGGVIGVANIIPGVSGGTMAVVLGIYERLIEAVSNIATDKERRIEYLIFLAKIGVGAVVAVGALSHLMDYLLSYHEQLTYLFFVGLIAGSVPSVYRAHKEMSPSFAAVLSFLAGAALILSFALLFPEVEKSKDINFELDMSSAALGMLFISGILAGGSMIVPGISGSFILVLLGQYRVVIKAVKELNIVLVGIIGLGAIAGIVGFAKLINICLKSYPKETIYFILGLVIASLYPIFPGLPAGASGAAIGIGMILAGAALALVADRS